MSKIDPVQSVAEQQRVFDLIWSQMPQRQNRMSSSWWFFLLFPEGENGYGPRQLMFAFANRAGHQIGINNTWLPGLDLKRPIVNGVDRFHVYVAGWYCDGRQVYEDLVQTTAEAELDAAGSLKGWFETGDGRCHGGQITRADRPLTLAARFAGPYGASEFETWGARNSLNTIPHESINLDTPLGGTHFIAWRKVQFAGDFALPGGHETMRGVGYFQRVCLNVPTFPWKWLWFMFADGSLFSAYVPYAGLHAWRRGYRYFSSEKLEQAALPLFPAAFWDRDGPSARVHLGRVRVTPHLNGRYPQFSVEAGNRAGDWLAFRAEPYGRAGFTLDRHVWGGLLHTQWQYNEFMCRVVGLNGRIGDRPINEQSIGAGFGNLEYTWGLGL